MKDEKVELFPEEDRHDGQNIQRIRIYLGIKQDTLANELNISRAKVSIIEQQDVVEDYLLNEISNVLGVSPDLIKKFDVEKAIYNINNYKDATINGGAITGSRYANQQINPLDKVVELYERLLKSEREKLELFLKEKTNT
ncbi:helix-turn-helix domain-containing protein [Rhizosphaericola mali]|uniref:Helix-turn-helix transcriptional regulator n=1 Tax=Rhizosphaericola mali TaxID=2545455 RepID=A0A5P2G434_9BACT|nr:helix-turn-helix transcriptional regulator [Rhizosphaericola mali]QES88520.1 helix-turn-helix transcriptional regulator [Rhizosphaericola mali]